MRALGYIGLLGTLAVVPPLAQTRPWARGAVAYLLPGQVLSLEPHIARPEGRIHCAGEHASSLRGWMQDAFESGRRAAGEVDAA